MRVPEAYLPVFCRELHQMVHSGLSVAEGLSLLREDETDGEVLRWLGTLCEYVDGGMPLAAALRETGAFPAYMTDMVALAEDTAVWRTCCRRCRIIMSGAAACVPTSWAR